MTIELDPVDRLLVAAASGRSDPGAEGPTDADGWRRLLTTAAAHRLLGLLGDHLKDHPPSVAAPPEVLDVLKRVVRSTTAKNLHLQADLGRIAAALDAAGIVAVPLKGAALLDEVYPHPGLRPMSDLDLLVPATDVSRAQVIVAELGFVVADGGLGSSEEERLRSVHHHFPLISGAGTVVELHHRLSFDRPGYDTVGVLERARPGVRPGGPLRPAPEDLLLHVAVHFAMDRERRMPHGLGQLADVVRIVERCDLQWDALVQRASDNAVADRLFLALDAADLLIGAVAPAAVLDDLRPRTYRPALGEAFVRTRVLAVERSLPLEELSGGPLRRVIPQRQWLEKYLRPTDVRPPSTLRLHGRRVAAVTGRLTHELPNPRRLREDVRLARWIVGLERSVDQERAEG